MAINLVLINKASVLFTYKSMKAYSYTVKHNLTGKLYYGIRKSNTFDLFNQYFTSSKIVKLLILQEGKDAFTIKLRKKFDSYENARLHESKLLSRLKVPNNPKLFNQAVSAPRLPNQDHESESRRRSKISKTMKEKVWRDPEYYKNQVKTHQAHLYPKQLKLNLIFHRGKQKYRNIQIIKNGKIKTIPQNFYPQYKKYNWVRL